MKLSDSILLVIIAYSVIYLGSWGYYEYTSANSYSVILTMYSDDEFNKKNLEELYIVQFNKDDIEDYPLLLELMTKAQSNEPNVNSFSNVYSTFDQTRKEIEYFSSKFLEKYPGVLPKDIYGIGLGNSKYTISLKETHFIYNDINYRISQYVFFKNGMSEITIWKSTANFQLGNNLVVTLTDQDLEKMPRFKEGLEQIGTIQYNTGSEKIMNESEFKKYEKLAMDIGIADEKAVFNNSFIEFEDRYYSLRLRI